MKNKRLINLILSALFIAIGIVLPFFTGQIPKIGSMLLPMHIPVLLCGLICGWQYGLTIGAILPLMRSMLFSMPPFYPTAVAMAFELAAYGFIIGFVYSHSRWNCIRSLYRAIIAAMLGGRIVWGIVQALLLGVEGNTFTLQMFLAGAFINALPGIVLQFILIPSVMLALDKTHLVPFGKNEKVAKQQIR